MQRVVSSNDDIIVEKSSKEGEKDIVNNEVASIPVKAIDTNENNEEEIEFKENVAEGYIKDENVGSGNIILVVQMVGVVMLDLLRISLLKINQLRRLSHKNLVSLSMFIIG